MPTEPGYLSQYSVWLRTGRLGFDPRKRQRIFPLTSASRPALAPTQPPIQWVPGAHSPGVKRGRGVMLTIHPLLVPRLRKSVSYTCCHPKCACMERNGTTSPFFIPMPKIDRRFRDACDLLHQCYKFKQIGRQTSLNSSPLDKIWPALTWQSNYSLHITSGSIHWIYRYP
jgi:hypothetical protein